MASAGTHRSVRQVTAPWSYGQFAIANEDVLSSGNWQNAVSSRRRLVQRAQTRGRLSALFAESSQENTAFEVFLLFLEIPELWIAHVDGTAPMGKLLAAEAQNPASACAYEALVSC